MTNLEPGDTPTSPRLIRYPLASSSAMRAAWAVFIGVNLGLILYSVRFPLGDWGFWESSLVRWRDGTLYDSAHGIPFVWSPIAAALLPLVLTLGYLPWAAVHIASVLVLRNRTLIALALLSWPFWIDLAQGNTVTFSVVASVAALRGSRPGAIAYWALLALMPRPMLIPVGVWLLWHHPWTRVPAFAIIAAHTGVVGMIGLLDDWVAAAIHYGSTNEAGVGLARLLGVWGLVLGIPIAGWLTVRGRLGWAGLVMSGYVLPQYLMILLLEAVRPNRADNKLRSSV